MAFGAMAFLAALDCLEAFGLGVSVAALSFWNACYQFALPIVRQKHAASGSLLNAVVAYFHILVVPVIFESFVLFGSPVIIQIWPSISPQCATTV